MSNEENLIRKYYITEPLHRSNEELMLQHDQAKMLQHIAAQLCRANDLKEMEMRGEVPA